MIMDTILYVISANGFWLSMGLTSSMGIFIGALLYNGDLKTLQKGILTIGIYSFFLIYTTWIRLLGNRTMPLFDRHPASTASLATALFVTLFYILGMLIGVYTLSKTRHYKK